MRQLIQAGQTGASGFVLWVQVQHIFQTNLLFLDAVQYGAEPQPGRDVGFIQLGGLQQKPAGPLALARFGRANSSDFGLWRRILNACLLLCCFGRRYSFT
jgi:hypothetical protein